jgi:tetrahydromethanopterin S-methyltransferase subunit G
MDDRLDRIEQKLDKISDEITAIKVTLHGQHVSIQEHIRRTEIAEANLEALREQLDPIEKHVLYVNGFLKGLGVVSIVLGLTALVLELMEKV